MQTPGVCDARKYRNEPDWNRRPRWFSGLSVQKLIRAAHAKEKQLPEELVRPPESP
jgi:hypothetical protein